MEALIGGLAALAVICAHSLAYLVVSPDPHHRAQLLSTTGHDRWNLIVVVGFGLFVASMIHFAAGRIRSVGVMTPSGTLYRFTVPRLAALQVGAFIGLEVLERWLSGNDPTALLSEPAVLIGIVLQIVCALLGAFLLVGLVFVVQVLCARSRGSTRRCPLPIIWHVQTFFPRFDIAAGGATLRGPPARTAHI